MEVPDALANVLSASPVALALVFVGVLVARVLDRRLGEVVAALGQRQAGPPRRRRPRAQAAPRDRTLGA